MNFSAFLSVWALSSTSILLYDQQKSAPTEVSALKNANPYCCHTTQQTRIHPLFTDAESAFLPNSLSVKKSIILPVKKGIPLVFADSIVWQREYNILSGKSQEKSSDLTRSSRFIHSKRKRETVFCSFSLFNTSGLTVVLTNRSGKMNTLRAVSRGRFIFFRHSLYRLTMRQYLASSFSPSWGSAMNVSDILSGGTIRVTPARIITSPARFAVSSSAIIEAV